MRNILIVAICAIILSGLISVGCDNKSKLLQDRLARTEKELEEVRANLEKIGRDADKVPGLLAKEKEYKDEIARLKAEASGATQEKETAVKEKEEITQKNKQLKDENTKLNTTIKTMRDDTTDAKRRVRELESALLGSVGENTRLNNTIRTLQEENAELKKRIAELEKGSGK